MAYKINYRFLLVVAVLFLGTFLRFHKISTVPPGIIQDEAALGYNSYSVLQTGKDEYGQILPLAFRSFTDYKLPLYIYMTVLPIKLWGLNVFSLRFASAFAGSLSSLLVFFLTRELFGKKRFALAATCMLVFATSPWSIFFSRAAHEANVGVFLFLLGLWAQLVGFRKNKFSLVIVSALFFVLTTYTYISFKFISLIFFPSTFIFFHKNIKQILIPLFVFITLAAPQYYLMRLAAGNNRISSLIDSQRVIPRYVSYFSPRSLFFDPDPDRNKSFPDLSTFYPWMVVPYLWGLFVLLRIRPWRSKLTLLAILALSPIPAAIAKDPFSNVRSLPLVFPASMVIGLGLEKILSYLPKKVPLLVIALLLVYSGLALYRNNFVLLSSQRYNDWVYGYKQISDVIKHDYPNSKILLNDSRGVYYAEFLFFTQYSPKLYQSENATIPLPNYYNNLDFNRHHSFGNFETRPIDWGPDSDTDQIIITDPIGVNADQAQEHHFEKIFTITGPDNKIVYTGYKTHPFLR